MSILTTIIKVKGKAYELSIDTSKVDRNYEDENYAEWFVHQKDGRILEVTVWNDDEGRFTHDGTVEVYKNLGDFEDGMLLDKKNIRLKEQ